MSIRPTSFSIPSTTELKVGFDLEISTSINSTNFKVRSLNGSVPDLRIISVSVSGSTVKIKTSPQVAGSYYILELKDSNLSVFQSAKGIALANNSDIRSLFFVGIDSVNPIRDRILRKVPSLFEVNNTVLSTVASVHATEMLKAQRSAGAVLADNYISESVQSELRTRSSGPSDRLANENVYEISRVTANPQGTPFISKVISYNSTSVHKSLATIPSFPVSLQENIILDEMLIFGTGFDGFLLTTSSKHVGRLLGVRVVTPSDLIDCNGLIGTEYLIDKYGYSVRDNYYDPDAGFSNISLSNSQYLLSKLGNIPKINIDDVVYISYSMIDKGISVEESTVIASAPNFVSDEALVPESNRFFLQNAPIVTSLNQEVARSGVTFKTFENTTILSRIFSKEIPFDGAQSPSRVGEYSINYMTGEVRVFGADQSRSGTGIGTIYADYFYKRVFRNDIDYALYRNSITAISGRGMSGVEASIEFKYDQSYIDGVDFVSSSHKEVFAEFADNRVSSLFSVKTLNQPITDVFKVFNQTTGEIYNTTYFNDTEIFFSGSNAPVTSSIEGESFSPNISSNEKLIPVAEFVSPAFETSISGSSSNSNITFYIGIPSELISSIADDYIIRSNSGAADIRILFFGAPDSQGLIWNCGIGVNEVTPVIGGQVSIGVRVLVCNLSNSLILNKTLSGLGALTNTSISGLDASIFAQERFFQESPTSFDPNLDPLVSLSSALSAIEFNNLSRIRKAGDYLVDYKYGIVYVGATYLQSDDVGVITYNSSTHNSSVANIISVNSIYKTISKDNSTFNAKIEISPGPYSKSNITLTDLPGSLQFLDGNTLLVDRFSSSEVSFGTVRDDYTVVVRELIGKVNIVATKLALIGGGLSSALLANRFEDKSSLVLSSQKSFGGENLFDENTNHYSGNIIDLKSVIQKRVELNTDGSFSVKINDLNFSSIWSVSQVMTGLEMFNSSLNISKLSGITSTQVVPGVGIATITFDLNTPILGVDIVNDYLQDPSGNIFLVQSFDTLTNTVVVTTPSVNNGGVAIPALGISNIIIKPTITVTGNLVDINIPSDAPIAVGEVLSISYLRNYIPVIGTEVVVDYEYGSLFFDYSAIKDDIVIWYEYGDNGIDWSGSNSILEGSDYYVTYKYGALRRALGKNFGPLTGIKSLYRLPLEIDREVYRNAIQSVLQSYPSGPTEDSIMNVGKIFSGITPEIKYSREDTWILGRDSLSNNGVAYSGDLSFGGGRFSGGLSVNSSSNLKVSAISSLPISEGSLSVWTRPNWGGIQNDAELTFDFKNIGKNYSKLGMKGVSWSALDLSTYNSRRKIGVNVSEFSNYKSDSASTNGLSQSIVGAVNHLSDLNLTSVIDVSSEFVVNRVGFRTSSLSALLPTTITAISSPIDVAEMSVANFYKNIGIRLSLEPISSYLLTDYSISFNNITSNTFLRLRDEQAEITIIVPTDLSAALSQIDSTNSSPSCFMIKDSYGDFYQVISFTNSSGEVFFDSIPALTSSITVSRFDLTNSSLTGLTLSEINALYPSSSLTLYAKVFKKTLNATFSDSQTVFNTVKLGLVDWSSPVKISINVDAPNNLVKTTVNEIVGEAFYTDYEPFLSSNIGAQSLSSLIGVFVGIGSTDCLSDITVLSSEVILYHKFSELDVKIGSSGYTPSGKNFKLIVDQTTIGMPPSSEVSDGIFIGFDDTVRSISTGELGQWRFVYRSNKFGLEPTSVTINSPTNYFTSYAQVVVNTKIDCVITSNGSFSSVLRQNGAYPNSLVYKSKRFRFSGNGLLESSGWSEVSAVDSSLNYGAIFGSNTASSIWTKYGTFSTSYNLGEFSMGPSAALVSCSESLLIGNTVYAPSPIVEGPFVLESSLRVDSVSPIVTAGTTGVIATPIPGVYTGISPIGISNADISAKIELCISSAGIPFVAINDMSSGLIIGTYNFNWNDSLYHLYSITNDDISGSIIISIDGVVLGSLPRSLFSVPLFATELYEPYIMIAVFDGSVADSAIFHSENTGNSVSIDFINYFGESTSNVPTIESGDVIIDTDSSIILNLNTSSTDLSNPTDYDEILFTSDSDHYLIDSKNPKTNERFSLYKDGKGFLNFRIIDSNNDMFNIASNVKYFIQGDLHHIGASWRIGSIDEKDEMHLFIDGNEVSNIYKFGGNINVAINEKFSDISKEFLQNFSTKDVDYCSKFLGGIVSASSSVLSSLSPIFLPEMLGRSILITDSVVASNLIGGEYIITEVIDQFQVSLSSGLSLVPITFVVSASDISFQFPPTAGIITSVSTDVRNSNYAIYRTDNLGIKTELGGIEYSTRTGVVEVISGSNIINPGFRINVDSRVIEFIGKDSSCLFSSTVTPSDLSVHIETMGIALENASEIIELSHSSYNQVTGVSSIKIAGREPVSLLDVTIRRVLLPRTIISSWVTQPDLSATFSILSTTSAPLYAPSSNYKNIYRANLGRKLELEFDSDNVDFGALAHDITLVQNGLLNTLNGTITVYGTTVDGVNQETFFLTGNGKFSGSKFFKTIDRIDGVITPIDPLYSDLGIITIKELNPLTVPDNGGEYCLISRYINGGFELENATSIIKTPFELITGLYDIIYPTTAKIFANRLGKDLLIGADFNGANGFDGVIEALEISRGIAGDVRGTEFSANNVNNITKKFNNPSPPCQGLATTCLIPLTSPVDRQIRALSDLKFLIKNTNDSFYLSAKQIEVLAQLVNLQKEFIFELLKYGISEPDATVAYYKIQNTGGPPVFNLVNGSYFGDNILRSDVSVNSYFGGSGMFITKGLKVLNSTGEFRPNEGSIEFWVSPNIDTDTDFNKRYYFDAFSSSRDHFVSSSTTSVEFSSPVREVLSVKLLNSEDAITFGLLNLDISSKTNDKELMLGSILSPDGRSLTLSTPLPGVNTDLVISYIPIGAAGDRVSVFKNDGNYLIFSILGGGVETIVSSKISWKRNSWHKILCNYRANSNGLDAMQIFVDGSESGFQAAGGQIVQGTGITSGQNNVSGYYNYREGQARNRLFKITLTKPIDILSIGSEYNNVSVSNSRIDNIRLSRKMRYIGVDTSGLKFDPSYLPNISLLKPLVTDPDTTYLNNFNSVINSNNGAVIIDPKFGVFDFKLTIFDDFDRIIGKNNGSVERIISNVINKIKPAHSNVMIEFKNEKC